jgi:hypothetical protein
MPGSGFFMEPGPTGASKKTPGVDVETHTRQRVLRGTHTDRGRKWRGDVLRVVRKNDYKPAIEKAGKISHRQR